MTTNELEAIIAAAPAGEIVEVPAPMEGSEALRVWVEETLAFRCGCNRLPGERAVLVVHKGRQPPPPAVVVEEEVV
ncbi:MAG: hypothetical protein VW405_08185 [Rhodospirillaceae bacterium]